MSTGTSPDPDPITAALADGDPNDDLNTDSHGDVIQVVVIPSLRPALEEWLASRMCVLSRIPGTDPDDLPTYVIGPNDAMMEALLRSKGER